MNIVVPSVFINHYKSLRDVLRMEKPTLGCRIARRLVLGIGAFTVLAIVSEVLAGLLEYRGQLAPETASWFRMSKDWSIGEIGGYLEVEAAAVLIFLTGRWLGSRLHLCLAGMLQFVVIDDALQLHEQIGHKLGEAYFQHVALVRPEDAGELSYALTVLLIGSIILYLHYRASTVAQRAMCLVIVAPLVMVAFASVGLDFVHALVPRDMRLVGGMVAIMEDGTELMGFGLLLLAAALQWKCLSVWKPLMQVTPDRFISRRMVVMPSGQVKLSAA